MKILVYLALSFFLSVPVLAQEQWQISEAPQDSGANWMASTSNTQGDKLGIWRKIVRIKFEAIGEFVISKGKLPKNATIKYSIDNGQNIRLDIIEQKGNRIVWRVWSSSTNEIFQNDALWHLSHGKQIELSWEDDAGNKQKTSFSLEGSSDALDRIISGSFK